ncbi:nucleoside hydrolase [Planctobacterium marinum]|uniref:nucleoside hydrolase n=1 Tax=Planctobacterium marinum TaxID=1631968 RepID=UPI001E369A1A|nr:nucleoside hydrolase [Planctobacterium marinum]MCC2605063.1 nucleoside hydrolase [Planctobacterium marinum]
MNKIPVIFDHDGGVDDLLSLMLLLTMEHVDLKAVCVTPADCFLTDATKSTLKILDLFGRKDVVVAQGNLHGINPFHCDWRAQPKMVNALPTMLSCEDDWSLVTDMPAHEYMQKALQESNEPVTVLMTGPCSNLARALENAPDCINKLQKVIWMGGAIDAKGNVANYNHDGSAEWNVYWDAPAADSLLKSGAPLWLMPLDATNCLPISMAFLKDLSAYRSYPLVELAGQFWACTVASIPTYEFTYYLWDVMATCCLGLGDDVIDWQDIRLSVRTSEPSEGNTYRDENGSLVKVAMQANRQAVVDYLVRQLQHNI